jgi:hypothetical protein
VNQRITSAVAAAISLQERREVAAVEVAMTQLKRPVEPVGEVNVYPQPGGKMRVTATIRIRIGNLSHLFYGPSHIENRESCQFLFCLNDEKPTVVAVGTAGEQSGCVRKILKALLSRIQSERRRRLALASSSDWSDCLEQIDSTSWGARRRARRWAQMAEDLVDHRRIFNRSRQPPKVFEKTQCPPPNF